MKKLLVFVLLAAASVHAQPNMKIAKIVAGGWPVVELEFTLSCNGQPVYLVDKTFLRLMEDGVEIRDFELFGPFPTIIAPRTTVLLLDASGNMTGAANAAAKASANYFVDQLNSTSDSTAVLWFNQNDTLMQNFTPSKPLLHAAIDSLPAAGNAGTWRIAGQVCRYCRSIPCRAHLRLAASQMFGGLVGQQSEERFRHKRHAIVALGSRLASRAVLHAVDHIEQSHLFFPLSCWQVLRNALPCRPVLAHSRFLYPAR